MGLYQLLRGLSIALIVALFWPVTAQAHPGHPHGSEQRLATRLTALEAAAPRALGNRCASTINVPGQGPSCHDPVSDTWLVENGKRVIRTHGPDLPSVGDAADIPKTFSARTSTRVANAAITDIACVTDAAQPHVQLLYMRALTGRNRYSEIAPLMREAVYQMGAFLDAEAKRLDPGASVRIPVLCGPDGLPVVADVPIAININAETFLELANALKTAGWDRSYTASNGARYLAFYDSNVSGIGGQGEHWNDDSRSLSNSSNSSNMFAVQYAFNEADTYPTWGLMLHEYGHTMGAVNDSAAHSTKNSHCNDGLDIMCYSDGGETSNYRSSICTTLQFDCNGDDYFNPAPSPDNYLARHWNVGGAENRYLIQPNAPALEKGSTPSAVGSISSSSDGSSVHLAWSAATDDIGISGYRIFRYNGSAWVRLASVNKLTLSYRVGGLARGTQYRFKIIPVDVGGQNGVGIDHLARTSGIAAMRPNPSRCRIIAKRGLLVKVGWRRRAPVTQVSRYILQRSVGNRRWAKVAVYSPRRAIGWGRLPAKRAYRLRVTAQLKSSPRLYPGATCFVRR